MPTRLCVKANYCSVPSITGQRKFQDLGVWNRTENLLLTAESDVLEIFDWWVPFARCGDRN